MNSPKLSVITVNRNNATGLRKTLQGLSRVRERSLPVEWVVVDGASTDESIDVIKEYDKLLNNWISEPDKGIYDAMNKGIKMVTGEYTVFMNSGDSFTSELLRSDLFETASADVVYGNFQEEKDGKLLRKIKNTPTLDFLYLLKRTINHQSMWVKTSHLKAKSFDINYTIVADWIFLFELMKQPGVKASYYNLDFCSFDISGMGTVNNERRHQQRKEYLSKMYSSWELESLELAARMRSKDWFPALKDLLDSPRGNKMLGVFLKFLPK